ncbi:hypothetical protein ACJROX_11880 [Pseudalkalibacillus sp. A8]|uniref:hypothetical protein n=1 Tax=Pseudalkalibacillus sp. A8 TaxID=3382641 RepID=UPI0038B67C44
MTTQVFGSWKNQPYLQRLITILTREQLPITKELITQSGKWLRQVDSMDKGIQAVKTMLIKNLPISEPTFKALYHVQDRTPFTTELLSLEKSLTSMGLNSSQNTVGKAITRILDTTTRNAALDIVKQLLQLYSRPTTGSEMKLQIESIFKSLSIKIPDPYLSESRSQKSQLPISDEVLLKELKVNMSTPKAELFFQQKLSQVSNTQMNWIKEQVNMKTVQKPQLNLIEALRGLGLTFENDLVHGQLGEMRNQPQLKAALLELLAYDLLESVKEKADVLLHRLTGQQLLQIFRTGKPM